MSTTINPLLIPGSVVQVQTSIVSGMVSSSVAIPFDDTIPQNTEGVEYASVSITPRSASSILVVEAFMWGNAGNAGNNGSGTVAIFQDSNVNAIAAAISAGTFGGSASCLVSGYAIYSGVAGSTTARTFKARFGGTTAVTHIVNGWSGSRQMGGVGSSGIRVTEISA